MVNFGVLIGYYSGIMTGVTDSVFNAKDEATRAQAATVILRALEKVDM